jgi:hypothetical protein
MDIRIVIEGRKLVALLRQFFSRKNQAGRTASVQQHLHKLALQNGIIQSSLTL